MREIVLIIMGLILALLVPSYSKAALTISDQLSSVIPSANSNHTIRWTVADAGGVAEGESFDIDLESDFNVSPIVYTDVDIYDDVTSLSLAADCSGADEASFLNVAGTMTIEICPGNGGAIASGSVLEIRIGTNASGGVNQIANPGSTGSYSMILSGVLGYSDSDRTDIAIMDGISVSAQVGPQNGNLRIVGYASPGALVYFLEGGSTLGTHVSDGNSYFDKTLFSLEEGIHIISIYATDIGTRNTPTISFSVNVIASTTTIVSGILLPPTFSLDASSVKRPAPMTGQGMAKNNATVQVITTGSGDSRSESKSVNGAGNWNTNINPKLHLGYKNSYAITLDGMGGMSEVSQTRIFEVLLSADLNVDNLVNLTDFSILMFNYGTSSPSNVVADINDNGPVDLVDFSVMMYYWIGG